jgi:hypothetical protein
MSELKNKIMDNYPHNLYPDNLYDWCLSVTRRYYWGSLPQDIIDHLRDCANFNFSDYKEAAFNQLTR